jgi:hypothetical protein
MQWFLRIIFRDLRGRRYEKFVLLYGINGSKNVAITWKMMKELFIQDLTEPMKILKKSRTGAFRWTS